MTIGQYLQPTKDHLPVEEYVSLRRFDEYKEIGLEMGFDIVESAPLVRSSYHAHKHL
jgi:lipoic acid synthetase